MFPYWRRFLSFRDEVENKGRYFYSTEVRDFLNAMLHIARERKLSIPRGKRYWRAQLGCDDWPLRDRDGTILNYQPVPYSAARMKPLREKASEGRANPKGIPFLYLSTNEKTAVSEVRPWVGSYVTLVEFDVGRDLQVLDCSRSKINPMARTVSDLDVLFRLKTPTSEEAMETVWAWIDLAFSEPVDRSDSPTGYVSTQVIAEFFKTNGLDGVKYKSLFNNGSNLALFDIDSAEQVGVGTVIEVTGIDVEYAQIHP